MREEEERVAVSYPLLPSTLHSAREKETRQHSAAAGRSTTQEAYIGMAATSASATASLSVAARLRHRQLRSSARVPAQPHPLLKLNRRSYAVSASAASLSPQSIWEGQGIRAEMDGHGGAASGDVMGLLLRERIIFLGNEIEDFLADAIVSQLLLLDATDPESDIRLFINSPGGSLSATMAIYDVMQLVRADVSTIGMGIAGSTAAILLGGGTKGKRFAMPNTRIMMHQPVGGASGQALDVEVQAREILTSKRNVTRIIAGFTGRTLEQVEKDIDRDRYMGPLEAVDYGIIDGVIDEDSIIALEPVPERVKPKYNYEELYKDPQKFLTPDVPDDEIY